MDLIELLQFIFDILFGGLRFLADRCEHHRATLMVMRLVLVEFFVRQKKRCLSLIPPQAVRAFNYFKNASSSKGLVFEFWELILSPMKSRIGPMGTSACDAPSSENTVLCYVAKGVCTDDSEEEESDDENCQGGAIQEGSGTEKPSKSSTSEQKVSSRIPHKRKSRLQSGVLAKRRKSAEEFPITDPELEDPSTDSKVESQTVVAPSAGPRAPFSFSLGSPIGTAAWSKAYVPADLTGSAVDKAQCPRTSDVSVEPNQSKRQAEGSGAHGSVVVWDIGKPGGGSVRTPEKECHPVTSRAPKIVMKRTALFRPYCLEDERKDTQQDQLQSTVGEAFRTREAVKPFSRVISRPGDEDDDNRSTFRKRHGSPQRTPASDIEAPDSGDVTTPVETHSNVPVLPPKLRRKANLLSRSVSEASGDPRTTTKIPIPPVAFEGLGSRIFDFLSRTRVFGESVQSPNPVASEGLRSRMMDFVTSPRMIDESGQRPNPIALEDAGAVGSTRMLDESARRPNPTASEGLGGRMVSFVSPRMLEESGQRPNPIASEGLGRQMVDAADSARILDESVRRINPEGLERQMVKFVASIRIPDERDTTYERPTDCIPTDEDNRDLQRALFESYSARSTRRREPEEGIERGAEEFVPWEAPKLGKFGDDASETVGEDEKEKYYEGGAGKYCEDGYYRSYPGIAEEPLKVKKDARYQKKFYKTKPVVLPRKIGKALRVGTFRQSHKDAMDEFAIRNREEDDRQSIEDNRRQAHMRRYVRHSLGEAGLAPGHVTSSFEEDSPSSSSSPSSSDSESGRPRRRTTVRMRVKFTMDVDLLREVSVKFAQPMDIGEGIIFCRDLFNRHRRRKPHARTSLIPVLRIVREKKGHRTPSVEEFLVCVYNLQDEYWNRRHSPVFRTLETWIELHRTPMLREISVPDGDYELVGDTLVVNAVPDDVDPENRRPTEGTPGSIQVVRYPERAASLFDSETGAIFDSIESDVSNEVSVSVEWDAEDTLGGSVGSSGSARLLEIAGYLDSRQLGNIRIVRAEVHSIPETANISEVSEDLYATSSTQGEMEQFEEEKSATTPQKSTTECLGETPEGDEESDVWKTNNICPTDSVDPDERDETIMDRKRCRKDSASRN